MERVDHRQVAELTRTMRRHDIRLALAFGRERAERIHTVVGIALTVVFDETEVRVIEIQSMAEHLLAVDEQRMEFCTAFVEDQLHTAGRNHRLTVFAHIDHFERTSSRSGKSATRGEGELHQRLFVAFGTPICRRAAIGIDIEHHFVAVTNGASAQIGLRQLHFHLNTVGGSDGRQSHALRADHVTVAQHGSAEIKVAQIREHITVAHHQARYVALLVYVRQAELHKLVRRLHFFEFRALFARTGQDAVAHEVALVRAGIIITRVQTAESLFHFFGIVDALVDPVPNGTTDA